MSINDNVLSSTSIETANAAIDKLSSLREAIRIDAENAPETYGDDEGVYMLFKALEGVLSKFRKFDSETDSTSMPADVVTLMKSELIPSLTATADKLEKLYAETKHAVLNGEGGDSVIGPYFEAYEAEDRDNEVARLQAAYAAVQDIAAGEMLSSALDAFTKAFA